jgi:hypothetical protein
MPEGLAVDKDGNGFDGFAAGMDFKKLAKKLTPSWLCRFRVIIRIAGFARRPAFRIRIRTAAAPVSEKSQ